MSVLLEIAAADMVLAGLPPRDFQFPARIGTHEFMSREENRLAIDADTINKVEKILDETLIFPYSGEKYEEIERRLNEEPNAASIPGFMLTEIEPLIVSRLGQSQKAMTTRGTPNNRYQNQLTNYSGLLVRARKLGPIATRFTLERLGS